jgi:hypothetical protein
MERSRAGRAKRAAESLRDQAHRLAHVVSVLRIHSELAA